MPFIKGYTPWNKGLTGLTVLGYKGGLPKCLDCNKELSRYDAKQCSRCEIKSRIPWNKGLAMTLCLSCNELFSRNNASAKYCSLKCHGLSIRGKDHFNWKGGMPKTNRRETMDYKTYREYLDWQKAVFSRDNWECQFCGKHGGILHADHIKSWAKYPALRFTIDNGRTLCPPCHYKTPTFGRTLRVAAVVAQ